MILRNFLKYIILISIIFSLSLMSQTKPRPKIMAHYMPWFQTPVIHGYWGYNWTMNHYDPNDIDSAGRRAIASHFYPLTGPYDTDDPNILEYQTLLMKISGIDGVLVDWYGIKDVYDYATINTSTQKVFSAIKKANLLFGIVYEDQTITNMIAANILSSTDAISHGKSVMKFLDTNWFNAETYLKINNHPVLLTFGPQYFKSSTDWDSLFSVLSVKPSFHTLDNRLAPIADGAFPWPPMWKSNSSGILTQSALNEYLDQFYLKASGWPCLVTSVFPGFKDIYQQAGVGSSYGTLDYQNGITFIFTINKALANKPDIIQVVTWNDYGEGTMVEPTEEFGYSFLESIQSVRDSLDTLFQYQKNDLNLPIRIFDARQKFNGDIIGNSTLNSIYTLIINGNTSAAKNRLDSLMNVSKVYNNNLNVLSDYCLQQNYPNPFNPSTIISYQLSAVSYVRLNIFDMLGKEVAVLVNERKSPGAYKITWDGKTSGGQITSSGVYFYSLTINGIERTARKLIFLK
jgi:hypothetical protein